MMEFKVRLLEEGDYENTLLKWWKDWKWDAPAKDFLPENGLGGIMVSKGDTDICAGFLYFTNSKAAWCEFLVSNKEYKDDDRSLAIKVLLDSLSEMGRWKGVKYVYTSLKNDSLIEKYKDCGYIQGSTGCTELIKIL
tara:strand:+ start:1907 stop:2317 length:411 start_codon:yes stop_codon:yes gene_type:complete